MPVISYFFFIAIGLVIGSFLTVVISRLQSGETVILGRSRCPYCRRVLSWIELIPVVSFLWQSGRCRGCNQVISFRYPIVEGLCAIVILALGLAAGRGGLVQVWSYQPFIILGIPFQLWEFLAYAFFSSSLIAISAYDFEHLLIPRQILLPLLTLGLGIVAVRSIQTPSWHEPLAILAAAVSAYFFFAAIWFFSSGRAMGLGDAELAAVIALWLDPMKLVLGAVFSFWIGALFGVFFMILGRLDMKSRIPFGPFLSLGALVSLIFGNGIIAWYINI